MSYPSRAEGLVNMIVRHVFPQRMPQTIQPILATVAKDATSDKIAEVADQIMEHTSVNTSIVLSTTVQENNELKNGSDE